MPKNFGERLEEATIYSCMPTSSTEIAYPEKKSVRDSNRKIVMTYYEHSDPSPAIRFQKDQKKFEWLQSLIDTCIAHENFQKLIREQRRTNARHAQAMKVSISRSAVRAIVTAFQYAYRIPIANRRKFFAYFKKGEAHSLVFAASS
jgi:hypothetical protein